MNGELKKLAPCCLLLYINWAQFEHCSTVDKLTTVHTSLFIRVTFCPMSILAHNAPALSFYLTSCLTLAVKIHDEKMTLQNSRNHSYEKMTLRNSEGHSGKREG